MAAANQAPQQAQRHQPQRRVTEQLVRRVALLDQEGAEDAGRQRPVEQPQQRIPDLDRGRGAAGPRAGRGLADGIHAGVLSRCCGA